MDFNPTVHVCGLAGTQLNPTPNPGSDPGLMTIAPAQSLALKSHRVVGIALVDALQKQRRNRNHPETGIGSIPSFCIATGEMHFCFYKISLEYPAY